MSSDVTIHISVGSGGTVSAQSVAQTAAKATEAPQPLKLEALQASSTQTSPAPLSPGELSAVITAAPSGSGPAPMAVEQLQAGSPVAAPRPQPFGSLVEVSGPPMPLAPEQIGAGSNSDSEKPGPSKPGKDPK